MAERYPLPKFHFQVEWGHGTDGLSGAFTEVSGLDVETELLEYRAGNMPEFNKIKFPGMQKYSNITLKRGTFKGDNRAYEWWRNSVQNAEHTDYQRDLIISLKNESGEVVVTWKAKSAWPLKVQSTDLKGDGNEVAIETMEVAHEGLTVEHA